MARPRGSSPPRPSSARFEPRAGLLFDGISLGARLRDGTFLADEPGLHRQVVVEFFDAASPAWLDQARRLANISHPSLVALHRIGTVEGMPYAAYAHVTGTPLERLPPPLTEERALGILAQLGSALAALHAAGLAHGRVHPSQVCVATDPTVARTGERATLLSPIAAGRLAARGAISRYAAPELSSGAIAPKSASDVFALGVLASDLLSAVPGLMGRPPSTPFLARLLAQNPADRPTSRTAALELERMSHARPEPNGRPSEAALPHQFGDLLDAGQVERRTLTTLRGQQNIWCVGRHVLLVTQHGELSRAHVDQLAAVTTARPWSLSVFIDSSWSTSVHPDYPSALVAWSRALRMSTPVHVLGAAIDLRAADFRLHAHPVTFLNAARAACAASTR